MKQAKDLTLQELFDMSKICKNTGCKDCPFQYTGFLCDLLNDTMKYCKTPDLVVELSPDDYRKLLLYKEDLI